MPIVLRPRRVLALGLLAMLALIVSASAVRAGGALQGLRSDVRQGVAPPPGTSVLHTTAEESSHDEDEHHHDHHDHHDACDDDFDDDGLLIGLFVLGLTSPFWGPPALLHDDYSRQSDFLDFPFKDDRCGCMVKKAYGDVGAKPWHLRLRGEYADDFDQLTRTGGHVLLDTTSRFGFDGEWNYRQEDLAGGGRDHLQTGDFNILFRFAQSECIQMRTGLGVNWLSDDVGGEYGFNFTYGGDWMPAKPWILSAEIDWGTLGEVGLFHFRTTVGVVIQHAELYAGYDYFDVGGAQISGWVAGLRLWF